MGVKTKIISLVARYTRRQIAHESRRALQHQAETFQTLIRKGKETQFGKDHHFDTITSPKDFARLVPIRDYEDLKPYIEQIIAGEDDVLWPGKPIYFAKTSGTTSGVKYIPITRDSIHNHIGIARKALFNMVSTLKLNDLFDGKFIFLSGSPVLDEKGEVPTGRLSGIVNHWIPSWLRSNQMPGYETNCIEDWEIKVDKIARETLHEDMRIISGIPPWVQMYYQRLLELSGKPDIKSLFPNLKLFVYGGVQFEPYRAQLEKLTGGTIASMETYPASEGFIAFQDQKDTDTGLLLQCHTGIFYEFVPTDEIHLEAPTRHTLDTIETGVDYALIMSTNAGLWAYSIGDTIEFTSKDPYRIHVTGRVKHFISAFGEHVIAKEVEEALKIAVTQHPCLVTEFTVAPQVNPGPTEKPYHEWWIEFGEPPQNPEGFATALNQAMVEQNVYYKDLIDGKILQPLIVRYLPPDSFKRYMLSIGKLGGQNKVPRLSNDRAIAEALERLEKPTRNVS
ncbi:MAG TPA: GH3 auxin-responsive promoter family protein [Saprospiraceae bacterium]